MDDTNVWLTKREPKHNIVSPLYILGLTFSKGASGTFPSCVVVYISGSWPHSYEFIYVEKESLKILNMEENHFNILKMLWVCISSFLNCKLWKEFILHLSSKNEILQDDELWVHLSHYREKTWHLGNCFLATEIKRIDYIFLNYYVSFEQTNLKSDWKHLSEWLRITSNITTKESLYIKGQNELRKQNKILTHKNECLKSEQEQRYELQRDEYT